MYEEFEFVFSEEKNIKLQRDRGISFERIVGLIRSGCVINTAEDKYPNQRRFVVAVDGYCWVVPHTIQGSKVFLRTAIRIER